MKKLNERLNMLINEVTAEQTEFKFIILPGSVSPKDIYKKYPEVRFTSENYRTKEEAQDWIYYFGEPGTLYALKIGFNEKWLIGGYLRFDESLNEMNDRTVYNVKQARKDNFRNSGYSREEGIKFGKNDTLYNQRIQSKGLGIEDGIDNLVNIGFDKLSAYKPSVVKVVKQIMDRACELGLAEPYDFGKGKGKYTTEGSIEDVVKGLLDDKIARKIAMNYVNKQNKGAGLPLRTDESLNEVKEITRDEWNKTPKDYKMIKDGKPYLVYLDDETHATVLGPCKIIDESLDGDIITVVDIPLVTEKLYNRLVNLLYGNKQSKNRDYEQQGNVLNFLQEIEDRIPLGCEFHTDLEDYGFTVDEINAIKKIVREERVDESLNEDKFFKKELTPLPKKKESFKIGDKVNVGNNKGEIIKVKPMRLSDTSTYQIKLDNGKTVWRYEEEIR